MKIRNGFVSNSSSSSFVLYGYKANDVFPKTDEDRVKLIHKYGSQKMIKLMEKNGVDSVWYDFLCDLGRLTKLDIDYLSDDGDGYFGYILADVDSDDGGIDSKTITIADINKVVDAFRRQFNIWEEPKFFMGTRAC